MILFLASAALWTLVRDQQVPERDAIDVAARHEVALLFHQITLHAAVGGPLDGVRARAESLGWRIEAQGPIWVVSRQQADGAGVYAFRVGPLPAEVVLQAPHPFYDLGTGALVATLFDESTARVACFATANRKREGNDVAHVADTQFQAATQGIAQALGDFTLVQLHGFGAKTAPYEAVLSPGPVPVPDTVVTARASQLATRLGWQVATGDDVPQLAGRTNVQARLLAGRARFVHLELSPAARRKLDRSAEARQALLDVLPWRPEDAW